MDLKNFYGDAYSRIVKSFEPNESIIDFLNLQLPVLNDNPPARKYLELGCGAGTHLNPSSDVWAVDFSEEAIKLAKADERFESVHFSNQNVVSLDLDEKFDFILDAHLLHCLVSEQDRASYLKNVFNHLTNRGLFYVETMISHKECTFESELEYFFFEPVLQQGDNPFRYIDEAENIERLLINTGFKILYFYIDAGKRMIPITGRKEALRSDPCVLRIIATKEDK